MTTPDVPLRIELSFEMPGTPTQVWHAIATGGGISSWFLPTDVEEREGGALCFHMGEDDSPGTVTGWDPPTRFAFVEPGWASLAGHEDAAVSPLATEFLVEAQSGGSCVVRVVTSAFGTGADWEQEFFDEMEKGWLPFFEHLRLYLANFPGQTATPLAADADVAGEPTAVCSAIRQTLGVDEVGQTIDARGLTGQVDLIAEKQLLLRLTDPLPGYVTFFAFDKGDGMASAQIAGYLFSEDAPGFVEREQPGWKNWLEKLAVSAS